MSNTEIAQINSTATVVIGTAPPVGVPAIPNQSLYPIHDALVPDDLQAGVAGLEKGLYSASTTASGFATAAEFVKPIGPPLDRTNVVYQLVNRGYQEALVEAGGAAGQAAGQAAGVAAGAWLLESLVSMATQNPYGRATTALIGGVAAATPGSDLGKSLTAGFLADLQAPAPLPNSTVVTTPTIVTADGSGYVLGVVDGNAGWYAVIDNPTVPDRYPAVTDKGLINALTDGYLKDTLSNEGTDLFLGRMTLAHAVQILEAR